MPERRNDFEGKWQTFVENNIPRWLQVVVVGVAVLFAIAVVIDLIMRRSGRPWSQVRRFLRLQDAHSN